MGTLEKTKLCLIQNFAPHYRETIFSMINSNYDCDWFLGKPIDGIKEMDVRKLNNVSYYKSVGNPHVIYYKLGIIKLLFKKKYQNFFMLAESRSISDWIFFLLYSVLFPQKKVYIWTHGWKGKESGLNAKLHLWLYKHVSGTFVYGDYAIKLLIDEGIPASKLFPIHNSLDYDNQLRIRRNITLIDIYKKHFSNDNPTIIFIGRLTKSKKLELLIEALSILKSREKAFNLVLIGDGEEKEILQLQSKQLGLEHCVWFYGACYDDNVNAELIYNADLCVSPGNIGLTAIHVLTFGCPAITHNDARWQGPEFEAIRPGVTGDFFEKDNLNDLVRVIDLWFSNQQGKRTEVRQACYGEIDKNWNPYYQMDIIKKNLILNN